MNNKMTKFALAAIITLGSVQFLSAKENIGMQHRGGAPSGGNHIAASCTPSTSHKDLDINKVRCPIWINGDMWWDLIGQAQYEVPKDSKKYSLFAGALWIGGKDQGGNLKVAAQTYRQGTTGVAGSGNDFWSGPVDTTNATTTSDVCNKYDRHWRVTRAEVKAFVDGQDPVSHQSSVAPSTDIKEWPGNGDTTLHQAHFLAPYVEVGGDPYTYNYADGDYPGYDLSSTPSCTDVLLGDQTLWWVFNDVGNIHTETHGTSIGLEIQAQAFAFATNDEINYMTFYKYKIINRSSLSVNDTYFGAWVDPDLGNYLDDYVGCDVKRGFGYCYNGDSYDEGITGYGSNPPAIGYDFFQGPKADVGDGIDNDRDGCKDCTFQVQPNGQVDTIPDTVLPELIIMSKFVYYNNDFSVTGNPNSALDYYNYMKGIWKDGTKITYGGNGHGGGSGATSDTCDFMFPGDSDPTHWGTHGHTEAVWDEVIAGNDPGDRRFLQSAGPFTLQPGAVNYITTGAVWARASAGGQLASVQLVRLADDKAQKLFDHCFAITNGPDAPDLSIRELSNELLFSISNSKGSNNYYVDSLGVPHDEIYTELDPNLSLVGTSDKYYHFEGYQVFQLKDGSVTTSDLHDPDKARLVFQSDIKNGIAQIVNIFRDPTTATTYGVEEVNGEDKGLRHVFRITKDKFATGNDDLINHKTYYYTVIAYGYNSTENDAYPNDGDGKPYLAGRRNIKTYTAIPHIIAPESNGMVLNTSFDDGPEITRIEGSGNGHLVESTRQALDLTQSTVDEIINSSTNRSKHPVYQRAKGPVDIRVYDPVNVKGGEFLLWADGTSDSSSWHLKNLSIPGSATIKSTQTLLTPYDQLIKIVEDPNASPNSSNYLTEYGFYINMTQLFNQQDTSVLYPGDEIAKNKATSGFVEATMSFEDPFHRWLTGVPDIKNSPFSWIANGTTTGENHYPALGTWDDDGTWGKMIGGTWTAYKFTALDTKNGHANPTTIDPEPPGFIHNIANKFKDQASVDIVITSDKHYWSKCMVIEQGDDSTKTIGYAMKGTPRRSPSLDIDGNTISGSSGFSYFPGYAINVETGERLNIAFGEDSYQSPDTFPGQHGNDMIWNPNSVYGKTGANVNYPDSTFYVLGGRHIIYVFGHNNNYPLYDGCNALYSSLVKVQSPLNNWYLLNHPYKSNDYINSWASCMWVGNPMLASGENMLDNKVTIRIRMAKPYETYQTDSPATNNNLPMYRFNTNNLVPSTQDLATAKSALDIINIVPNPYYAFSSYETNQLDNRVKIINLPLKCTVSIYTPSGTLIRKLTREITPADNTGNTSGGIYPETNLETALDWDLKNSEGIPVASGVYIIHINAPGIGEKTIKWFGVLRPIDLDTF